MSIEPAISADDHQNIAFWITQPEQRWDRVAHPADLRVDVDPGRFELRVIGINVLREQADAGLAAAGR